MPVPDFQSVMLPLLQLAANGQEHTLRETIESLALTFQLSEADREGLLPSGRQPTFDNRVGWARTYLKKAGLLESVGRARLRITGRGLTCLGSRPERITVRFLDQFPEFQAFHTTTAPAVDTGVLVDGGQTPEETVETGFQSLQRNLAAELSETIAGCSPKFFEQLVVDLLIGMGYGGSRREAGEAVGQRGDGGIDGIIKEDRLGLDSIYIQAKRWEGAVGRPVVQAFVGGLEGQRARKGVLITTSTFSQQAKDYVRNIEKKIVLIDGDQLVQFLIEHNIGVSPVVTYTVKKVNRDYFETGNGAVTAL